MVKFGAWQAKAWHYTHEDYQLSRSDQVLSPQRLKQLDRVSSLVFLQLGRYNNV
ncbi:MAG: hypothetical protein P4L49_02120 [Desulfosporosinus sp.]|nr:hypothetical protein [Desulfosporosinus sp.]